MTKKINTQDIIDSQVDEHKVYDTPELQALAKPSMWIGSSTSSIRSISVLENDEFVEKDVEIIPSVSKLIEEIINNSADEYVRSKDINVRGWHLNEIVVDLNKNGHLKVWDNGGITADKRTDGFYPVEIIFGKLFSSSNYDDKKERKLGGTNGVGSSLTNLFSNRFTVHSADSKNSVHVEWSNNKSDQTIPFVQPTTEHYTRVDAELDLERFDLDEIPYDIIKYIERKCIILAASKPGLKVTFNGDTYLFDSFKSYVDMYKLPVIGEKNKSWEIYLAPCIDSEPKRYAIVNGYECNLGTHIKHAEFLINWQLGEALKKAKITNITSQQITGSYHIFMNIEIDRPVYDSQSKDELGSVIGDIDPKTGKRSNLYRSPEFKTAIETGDIFKILQEKAREKDFLTNSKEFQKKAKELKGKSANSVKKLMDAGAKTKKERQQCELWIFEGESAGSGFRPNRDNNLQGAYFLKGKCVNSIEMPLLKVLNNQEFSDIFVALGLDAKNPSDLSKLRYGKIIVATDMDYDGHSIFGQLMTFFSIHTPELVKSGMIHRAMSPLWKSTKGKDIQYFYTHEEFEKFTSKNKGYSHRHFKGLGSLKKEDYKIMLKDSRLEKFSITDECIDTLHAFMGSDSKPRKRLLEAHV